MVAVLQCLQRLTSSRFASADMVISPSYAARIFSALTCGDDAVATEVTHCMENCTTDYGCMLYCSIVEGKGLKHRVAIPWAAHEFYHKCATCPTCRQRGY